MVFEQAKLLVGREVVMYKRYDHDPSNGRNYRVCIGIEATGSVTVTYTDGATQSFTISFADWYADTPTSTDQLVDQTSTWDPGPLVPAEGLPTTHPVSVYSTSVPLDPNKTVASVTLPDISPGIGNSQTGMHIFDMAIG